MSVALPRLLRLYPDVLVIVGTSSVALLRENVTRAPLAVQGQTDRTRRIVARAHHHPWLVRSLRAALPRRRSPIDFC